MTQRIGYDTQRCRSPSSHTSYSTIRHFFVSETTVEMEYTYAFKTFLCNFVQNNGLDVRSLQIKI